MTSPETRLVLASSSPRRRELMTEAGYTFDVLPASPDAESGTVAGETPGELVARLARQKAADVVSRLETRAPLAETTIVIACDTLAEHDGVMFGKPRDEAHAREMLQSLRGQQHRVLSGLVVWPIGSLATVTAPTVVAPAERVVTTVLEMLPISDAEIETYLATGLWQGKSGAFGYQDRTGWLRIESGTASNVVGLPMAELAELLAPYGVQPTAEVAIDE